jgi:hypothetical protein
MPAVRLYIVQQLFEFAYRSISPVRCVKKTTIHEGNTREVGQGRVSLPAAPNPPELTVRIIFYFSFFLGGGGCCQP